MSGHSKWHKLKHKKGAADKARGNVFTKLLKAVTVAAGQGGADPDMNFSLRLAIEKAKAGNVPKENIERAIKRGSGEGKDAAHFEEVMYEAVGPGGVGLMIECLTDNTNRTVTDVKTVVSKHGGTVVAPGSVKWQFQHKGVIQFSREKKDAAEQWDELELALIDAGVEDISVDDDSVLLICPMEVLQSVRTALEQGGIHADDAHLEWVAKEQLELSAEDREKTDALLDALDENDDVKDVYTNAA